jgi:DNA repair exonuclease SbcCD nuclease subunit
MKVALISDIHFGVRGDSPRFHDNMEKFFSEIFFPELKKRKISEIINLGDLFHSRKKIDIYTLYRANEYFFKKLYEYELQMYLLLGNHDQYFNGDNYVNSPNLLCNDAISIIDKPMSEGGITFIPWIDKHNFKECQNLIKNSNDSVCMGHFELKGFNLNKYQVAKHGMPPKILDKFEKVFSGHYHSRQSRGSIHYLGSPTQQTWADVEDPKGFYIFDTETYEIEFIHNPYDIFKYIDFSKENEQFDIEYYKDCYIKVFNLEKLEEKKQEKAIQKLEELCYGVQISVNKYKNPTLRSSDEVIDIPIHDIIKTYVYSQEEIEQDIIYNMIIKKYNEYSV